MSVLDIIEDKLLFFKLLFFRSSETLKGSGDCKVVLLCLEDALILGL